MSDIFVQTFLLFFLHCDTLIICVKFIFGILSRIFLFFQAENKGIRMLIFV